MRWYSAESAESLVVRTRQMAGNLMGHGLPNLLLITRARYSAIRRVMTKESGT